MKVDLATIWATLGWLTGPLVTSLIMLVGWRVLKKAADDTITQRADNLEKLLNTEKLVTAQLRADVAQNTSKITLLESRAAERDKEYADIVQLNLKLQRTIAERDVTIASRDSQIELLKREFQEMLRDGRIG